MRRVLVVDDDKDNIELLTQYLSREGHSVQSAGDADGALHRIKAWKPHLILLDVNLPGVSGLELIPRVRDATAEDYTPVILISGNMAIEDVNKGLDAGADDYLTKPFRAQELLSRVRTMLRLKEVMDALRRSNHRIEELSQMDDLTGLLNMRELWRRGEAEILRSRRFKKPVSGLLVNLDGFSKVIKDHGFVFGSQVLRDAGKVIKSCLRSIDHVARVGSDEYFLLLVETDLAAAEFMAERVRDALQSASFHVDKHVAKVTASIGVACILPEATEQKMSDLFHTTAEALHSAKASGPNSIEVYSFG